MDAPIRQEFEALVRNLRRHREAVRADIAACPATMPGYRRLLEAEFEKTVAELKGVLSIVGPVDGQGALQSEDASG